MTLADILTLSKAGFTAQQITAMNQQDFQQAQPVQQVMESQPVRYVPVQQAQPVQYAQQAQPVQYVQPNSMTAPQAQQAQVPVQYVQPNSMTAPQAQQAQVPVQYVQAGGGYVPTLPPTAQADPMKDVMLQNYMNVPGTNMYNVHDVVADMIGATAPAGLTQTGGTK